jgi:hypothetical protein
MFLGVQRFDRFRESFLEFEDRFKTLRNGKKRSGTLNGRKRLQNHVHGTVKFTFQY